MLPPTIVAAILCALMRGQIVHFKVEGERQRDARRNAGSSHKVIKVK